MSFNKKLAAVGVLTLLATAITALALSAEPPELQKSTDENKVMSSHEENISDQIYILRDVNGYVCVYTGDNTDIPTINTEIDVSRLRAYDAELLKDGIAVTGNEELVRILEDLGS